MPKGKSIVFSNFLYAKHEFCQIFQYFYSFPVQKKSKSHKINPFTNTFIMQFTYKRAFFALVLSTTCLTACQPNSTKRHFPPPTAPTTPHEFYPTEMESYIPRELPTNEDVWDVTATDISTVDPSRKLIAFTFDDTPAKTLENILAVFAIFNEANPDCIATATLFCNGRLINETSVHTLHTAYALGWELGNHSYSHPDFTTLSDLDYSLEIERTDELLFGVDGKEKHLFRPPFGKIDERSKTLSTPVINWTIDTLDWTGVSETQIYETVFSQKSDGAIVLMHDGYPSTVDALKRLLPDLKKAGYQAVSVSQLSKAHDRALKNGVTYIRARKKD